MTEQGAVPPGYKRTEVGVIPEDWEVLSLGELGTFMKGKGIKRDDISNNGLLCIRYGELYTHYNNYVIIPQSRISEKIAATALPIKKGDLLFAGSGETAEEIGKCVAYLGDQDAFAGGDIVVLRSSGQNSLYLGHLLNHDVVTQQKARYGQGDAVVHINASNLAKVKVPLSPIKNEQNSIAAALSDVDGLIGALDALIAKKRDMKQAAMQQLLTGRTRLPGFEGEWEEKRLGDVLERIVGGGTPSRTNRKFWGGHIPWATVKDFGTYHPYRTQETITKEGLDNSASNLIRAGTLITSTRMLLGKCVIYQVDVCINQDLKALFCNNSIDVQYLLYWFQYHEQLIDEMGSGSTVKGLSTNDLKSLYFVSPSISEQTAIATALSDMDAEIAALERRRDKVKEIKQGMMQQLLTGKVRLISIKKHNGS
ncbi:restriction endonuclease subunit S [Methanocalculus chunghsingensis]|uniref:restriction endonuclease subunit S n=1 Tax=Methanocalculus chunghsingensis TaxID=156457 RepID=UPI001B8D9637|nr:restriction endonuclease subunit S [Methanocalculus chunghsingensis]